MPFPVLIIGIGNTLRGDDGAGIAVAMLLENSLPSDSACVIAAHQLLPELAEPISRCRRVIFVDADATLAPGEHRWCAIEPADRSDKAMGHHQSPSGLLRMAGELFGRSPPASLHSIGGETFGYALSLSPQTQLAVHAVADRIIQDISTLD
jgi:hydrogenase maturation protease